MSSAASAFRMTRQREVLLEELCRCADHPTADQLYARVRRRLPRISLGTVYRNLEVLASRGMITRVDVPGAPRRYDGNTYEHGHARCVKCGKLVDVPHEPCREIEKLYRGWKSFRVTGHRLELLGLCARCESKMKGEDRRTGVRERKTRTRRCLK